MLDAKERYGLERQTKSYPKRKLLPQFDDEALEPIPLKYNYADQPDRPPRGRDKAAAYDEHQPGPPHHRGKDVVAPGYTYNLRQDLDNRAGQTRSIYGSRGRAPVRDNDYDARRDNRYYTRDQNRTQMSVDLRRDIARYRGAAHPLCFTDEVTTQIS